MLIEFANQFVRRAAQRYYAKVGDPIVQEYVGERDSTGVLHLLPSGKHDLYQDIQSYAASCDLQVIINRYFNGDSAALSRVQGVYADMVGMPDSIHEVYNLMHQAESDFAGLPAEVKSRFGNDPVQFLSTLGTPDWLQKMQIPQPESDGEAVDVVADAVSRANSVRDSEVSV